MMMNDMNFKAPNKLLPDIANSTGVLLFPLDNKTHLISRYLNISVATPLYLVANDSCDKASHASLPASPPFVIRSSKRSTNRPTDPTRHREL